MSKQSKCLGELNGRWALLFKVTQILWAILLPILLAVLLKWLPWITKEAILNEQYRAQEGERQKAMRYMVMDELRPIQNELRTHKHPMP